VIVQQGGDGGTPDRPDTERLLLLELNHRVKNSLQTVASVLRIQEATVDEACRAPLREASLRVTAIARVHGSLYRAAEMSITATYLHDILSDLRDVMPMQLEEEIAPVKLGIDMAVPLALFLTEAVTNAVKHNKLPPAPRVKVSFGPVGEDQWFLEVADSGQGFPDDFEAMFRDLADRSVGMRLMRAFATQLNATVSFFTRDGGIVRLCGPVRIPQIADESGGRAQHGSEQVADDPNGKARGHAEDDSAAAEAIA
jgi:two-component sensor histidine kinase